MNRSKSIREIQWNFHHFALKNFCIRNKWYKSADKRSVIRICRRHARCSRGCCMPWYTTLTTFIAYRLFSASKYSLKTEKRKDWEENIQNILCSGHLTEKAGMEWDLLLDTCIFYLLTKHVFQLYLFILINWIKNNASHPNVLSITTSGHLLFCLLRRKCACSFIEVIREPP